MIENSKKCEKWNVLYISHSRFIQPRSSHIAHRYIASKRVVIMVSAAAAKAGGSVILLAGACTYIAIRVRQRRKEREEAIKRQAHADAKVQLQTHV